MTEPLPPNSQPAPGVGRRHPGHGPPPGRHHRRRPLRRHRVRAARLGPGPGRPRRRRTPPGKRGARHLRPRRPPPTRAAAHPDRVEAVETLGGPAECRRADCHCGSCRRDATVGRTDRRLSSCGAAADGFGKGTDLPRPAGGTTGFGGEHPRDRFRDGTGRPAGHIAIDATGVRRQAEGGGEAGGRMADVGMTSDPLPDPKRAFAGLPEPGEAMPARSVSAGRDGAAAPRAGGTRGSRRRPVRVAIPDGGSGLEDFSARNFPPVEAVTSDLDGASEWPAELAEGLHPSDEAAATKSWCRVLGDEGGHPRIGVLEAWEWPSPRGRTAVPGHSRSRAERMDDPTHEGNGRPIGSGAVEGACETAVGRRPKGAGMRWLEAGAHAVCRVRALCRSESSRREAFRRRALAARPKRPPTHVTPTRPRGADT